MEHVVTYLESQNDEGLKANFVISDTVPPQELELEQRLMSEAQLFFGSRFAPEKLTVVMFTNEDHQRAEQTLAELGGSFPNSLSEEINKRSAMGSCNFAFATQDHNGDPIYYECVDTRNFRSKLNYQNPAHEYYHLVHYSLAPVDLPLWQTEGTATFFGASLGFDELDATGMLSRDFIFATSGGFDPWGEGIDNNRLMKWMRTASEAEVIEIYQVLHGDPADRAAYAHYGLGQLATEALIASFGVPAFLDFVAECSVSSPEIAFEASFGLTMDEFYKKLTPYINAVGDWKYESIYHPPKPATWPKDLDDCDSSDPMVVGQDQSGQLVYLSCGPDSKLHPQNGAPEIDQETGWPVEN